MRSFKPSICNRLDRNTSGLLVCGKSLPGLQNMAEMFRERSMKKFYRCIVAGDGSSSQYIKGYLAKDKRTNTVRISKNEIPDSQPIETEYRPIEKSLDKEHYLEVHLITGRTHQIRAHLASVGHPIVGDYKYGNEKINQYYKREVSCDVSTSSRVSFRNAGNGRRTETVRGQSISCAVAKEI